MHFLNILALLSAVTFAAPVITYHETIPTNPIQVHKSPFSWLSISSVNHPRSNQVNSSSTSSNITWHQTHPAHEKTNLTHYRLPEGVGLNLIELLIYLAGQEEASWSVQPVVTPLIQKSNVTIPTHHRVPASIAYEPTSALQEAEWCWDHASSYFKKISDSFGGLHLSHAGKFVTFTACMGRMDVEDPATTKSSSIHEKREFSTEPLSGEEKQLEIRRWKKSTPDPVSSLSNSGSVDKVEGHSISAFWSKLLPHHSAQEIEKFLRDLGGYYRQKKTGTHSSQSRWKRGDSDNDGAGEESRLWDMFMARYPDYLPGEESKLFEKRNASPTSIQTLVILGIEEGKKAKLKFKLAKGALVKNGHWDGAMRSKKLDEDADCGIMDHAYLNERCVKSNLSV